MDKRLQEKLAAANYVLNSFAEGTRISREPGGWFVSWPNGSRDGFVRKRFRTQRGNNLWPAWHQKWGQGGTKAQALVQLVRWLRGQPVLPIAVWQHWASPGMRLLPEPLIRRLLKAGYPRVVTCVVCEKPISVKQLDWWSQPGVSGPCHLGPCEGVES